MLNHRLKLNMRGRDFVVGDLHGAYEALMQMLKGVNFDPIVDRLISVGDLVDRGPDSLKCLRLVNEPWFYCVLGNHEIMMMDFITGGPWGQYWERNGGDWFTRRYYGSPVHDYDADEKLEILQICVKLNEKPLILTVELPENKIFHVMHAEFLPRLGMSTVVTDAVIADPYLLEPWSRVQCPDGDAFIWGRWVFRSMYEAPLEHSYGKISRTLKHYKATQHLHCSHIYSGHTIIRHPVTVGPLTNLDTKAYETFLPKATWQGLTMCEPLTRKFWRVTQAAGFHETQPVSF